MRVAGAKNIIRNNVDISRRSYNNFLIDDIFSMCIMSSYLIHAVILCDEIVSASRFSCDILLFGVVRS